MSFDNSHYKPKSRYNALKISKKTPEIARRLEELKLIRRYKGFQSPQTGVGFVSRIQPTAKLISRFMDARFPNLAITTDENREAIELNDKVKKLIEYVDTTETIRMRSVLRSYNDLLQKTHIDCCHLKEPQISRRDGTLVRISQHSKFTKRVFNENSWKKGGRFYGGFWQQIPSNDRQFIRIDGKRTVEIDYSGLHIVLLYAEKGKNYWTENDGASDPYSINVDGLSKTEARILSKLLLLMSINAADEKSAFKALRSEINSDHEIDLPIKLTDVLLKGALKQLQAKHPLITDKMCSGAGIDLQYIDSQMTEALIKTFTDDNIPLLAIHDSYIVPHEHATLLRSEMERVFVQCTNVAKRLSDDADDLAKRTVKIKQIGYDDEYLGELDLAPDADNADVFQKHKDMIAFVDSHTDPNYYVRLDSFQKEQEIISLKGP